MARGPEGKIQDKLTAFMREHDVLYKKQEVGRYFVSSGWLDFLIFPGDERVFVLEVKAPGGKLTPLQQHRVKDLECRGYKVFVVDSAQSGIAIIANECGLRL